MNKSELLKRIQQLSFAKTETELFLDTHPDCRAALDYYKKTVDELEMALEEFHNKYGPLVAMAVNGDRWNWIDGPWPWHIDWNENGNGMQGTVQGRTPNGNRNGNGNSCRGTDTQNGNTQGNGRR